MKVMDGVPSDLLRQFDIPQSPVIFRGSEISGSVAEHFVLAVIEVVNKIRVLLKSSNIEITKNEDELRAHEVKTVC